MVEVLEAGNWRTLGGRPARIGETEVFSIRGLPPRTNVRLGPVGLDSDDSGCISLRFPEFEDLDCHVGYVPLEIPGWRGEIEIVPGKISEDAYRILRAELEATWTGLLLDADGPSSLQAKGPDPQDLWRRLSPAIQAIQKEPLQRLEAVTGYRRLERVRRVGELTPSVLIAGRRGVAALTRVIENVPARAEQAFVSDTLDRLVALALRQSESASIASEAMRWQRESRMVAPPRRRPTGVTHAIRHDRRYRVVRQIRRELDHPTATLTEGPGELRLGVKGLNRLYEYWVYLKVLEVATSALGSPNPPGFDVLGKRLVGGRLRLELLPGTTVTFPGGWSIAFEPEISTNPTRSWRGLRHVNHPDPQYKTSTLTPDICILNEGDNPRLYVIDAKYRGRFQIDPALTATHTRYGRIALHDRGIVQEVIVAHPHRGLQLRWAGQSAKTFRPGDSLPDLPWFPQARLNPEAVSSTPATAPAPVSTPITVAGATLTPPQAPSSVSITASGTEKPASNAGVVIIADQTWLREHLGGRRVNLGAFARGVAGSRPFKAHLIAPDLPMLEPFFAAISHVGWHVERTSLDRNDQLRRLDALCDEVGDATIVVVSGRADFIATSKVGRRVEVVREVGE